MTQIPDINSIRTELNRYQAKRLPLEGNRQAAVCMLLRERNEAEVLLIQRAFYDDDPWSGQMAFPGGMREPDDANSRVAAEREALEEISVDLSRHTYVGRLDDQQGRHAGHPLGLVVSAHVYEISGDIELEPNHEVADVVWTPLSMLFDEARATEVRHPRAPDQLFPGIVINADKQQILWGLTRRFLEAFFQHFNIPRLP